MVASVAAALLALSLFVLCYTYVGYPIVLSVLRPLYTPLSPTRYEEEWPSVTMVVAVHNEASVIGRKVENTREIDYPGEFRCLFVSDSTDGTEAILATEMADWMDCLSLPERRGKSHALNEAMERVDSDVVVFSDANTMYEPDAVQRLVAPLADDRIGCVTGTLRLQTAGGDDAEGSYWRYELWLRRLERTLGTTVSVNGGMLALRRTDFEPLPEGTLVDDLVIALRRAREGERVHYEEAAVATEYTAGSLHDEFRRRVRIGAGNYRVLVRFAALLSPTRGIVALQFLSHKVLRWLAPCVLLLALGTSLSLAVVAPSPLPVLVLGGQVAFYLLAGVGTVSPRARTVAVCRVPAYFTVMNVALAVGCIRALSGADSDLWAVTPRQE